MIVKKGNAKSEKASALLIVLIILLLAGLTIPPLLHVTSTSNRAADNREREMLEFYSAEGGLDNVLYQIRNKTAIVEDVDFDSPTLIESPLTNDCDLNLKIEEIWLPQYLPELRTGANYTIPINSDDPTLERVAPSNGTPKIPAFTPFDRRSSI